MAQDWDPKQYETNAGFVAELGRTILDWLDPQSGERVLDLGCGDGRLTAEISERGCDVLGVDSSDEQVQAARERGLNADVADAENLAFDHEFDAVFTNAVLHWVSRPAAVVAGVARALRPGGRFVGEFGGAGNVAVVCRAMDEALRELGFDPSLAFRWYFPTPQEFHTLLAAAGFSSIRAELFQRPTLLPNGLASWIETFGKSQLELAGVGNRDRFLARIEDLARDELFSGNEWQADYVRLRFSAYR